MSTATAEKRPAPVAEVPNDLRAFWLPFTPNRAFKQRPRMISARQGYALFHARRSRRSSTGQQDCGAAMPAITASRSSAPIQKQAGELDYRPGIPIRPSEGL